MSGRRDRPPPRKRRSPTQTVAHLTDEFMDTLDIPPLPEKVPARLEEALGRRIDALLYRLQEARGARYARPLEVRLVRDAHRAVLAAFELNLADAEVRYAELRRLLDELGYERADVGFRRRD